MKGRDNLCGNFHCCLKELPEPLQTSATTTPDQSVNIHGVTFLGQKLCLAVGNTKMTKNCPLPSKRECLYEW